MAFNYYNNRSIIGRASALASGINIINTPNIVSGVTFVSSNIAGGGELIKNDISGLSIARAQGNSVDNSNSSITITYNLTRAATLVWTVTVSSELGFDTGSFIVNGTSRGSISGENTVSGTTLLVIGQNTIIVIYSKDEGGTQGSDSITGNWLFL